MANSKTIFITGCSSGIGLTVALGLQKRNYRVIASARKDSDVLKLKEMGLTCLQLDLDEPQSIDTAVQQLNQLCDGKLDALFNNGAYGQAGAVEDLSREALRAQFETNVFGTIELTNRILPMMRRQGHGRIIQNSSVLGLAVMPFRGAYNASKFALEALSDTLRLELRYTDIHVILIEPGPIESRFRANSYLAFKKYIKAETSVHHSVYAAMERRLTKEGAAVPFTLPADAVLKKVIHALESPNPKIRYYVTFPTYLFAYLKRLLPYRLMDKVMLAASGAEGK
ncbi:MAG: SDR family oxidoreductase [Gammaproteobacteria bacterium]|nr:SDR family oxidoreductase [Gammaproteobacteria bacterium]MDH5801123.1 SDR family oxidoreductase [Gammaproteobacteria bacterium]